MTVNGSYILRKKNKPHMTYGARLSDAILFEEKQRLWPTPTVNDSKNNGGPSQFRRKGTNLNVAVAKRGSDGGRLNPEWVEWLMGFPKGWTDLNHSETQ
jgi:hypothetical protein